MTPPHLGDAEPWANDRNWQTDADRRRLGTLRLILVGLLVVIAVLLGISALANMPADAAEPDDGWWSVAATAATGAAGDAVTLTTGAVVDTEAERATVDHPGPGWATLTGCDLMAWHAAEYNLPDMFGGWLGFAESSCRNDVTSPTGCCTGYWQIHRGWEDWAPADRLAECGVTSRDDWIGADPVARSRNACMARIVYDIQGACAWTPYIRRYPNRC